MKRILVLFLCLCVAFPAFADSQRVFDNAGLFTDEEIAALEEMISEFQQRTKTDFAVLTTDDFLGHDDPIYLQAFAKTFFASQGFGLGPGKSGLILYIDSDARKYCVVGDDLWRGYMQDERNDEIIIAMHGSMVDGNYFSSARIAIEEAEKAYLDYWTEKSAE